MFKVLVGFLKNKKDAKFSGCKEPSDSRQWRAKLCQAACSLSDNLHHRTQQYHADRNLQNI